MRIAASVALANVSALAAAIATVVALAVAAVPAVVTPDDSTQKTPPDFPAVFFVTKRHSAYEIKTTFRFFIMIPPGTIYAGIFRNMPAAQNDAAEKRGRFFG